MLLYLEGFLLGLVAPLVMFLGCILAIPDLLRLARIKSMSRGSTSRA